VGTRRQRSGLCLLRLPGKRMQQIANLEGSNNMRLWPFKKGGVVVPKQKDIHTAILSNREVHIDRHSWEDLLRKSGTKALALAVLRQMYPTSELVIEGYND
jgi:hypothetical protein